jgi:putative oxidoreductase
MAAVIPLTERRWIRVVAVLLGLALCGGGASKLASQSTQVTHFIGWGLPRWFLMLVGTFEVIGGALLALPASRPVGSLILGTIMVGALWTHVVHAEWVEAAPVVLVFVLLMAIFRGTRARAIHLLGGA